MSKVSSKQRLSILISTLGTILEWAEYTFYGYLAFKISELFFPPNSPGLNLLKTYAIFAIGYIMRPLGAIFFGYIGDNIGRKTALMLCVFMMGGATLAIAFLPTYESIGLAAPISLLLLRLIQGFAISAEYTGAGVYLIEQLEKNRACFASACISASTAGGMVLGGVAAYLVSLPGAPDFAWRLPFLLGGLSCMLSAYARAHLSETPEFEALQQNKKRDLIKAAPPLLTIFKSHKRPFVKVCLIAAFSSVFVYVGNIYMVVFLKAVVGLPAHHASLFAISAQFFACIIMMLLGYWADKHQQPQKQFEYGLLISSLSAPLIFALSASGNYAYISMAMFVFALCNGLLSSCLLKLLYDEFPTQLRYTGLSVAWSSSAAVFGGSSPMLAHYLVSTLDWKMGPGFYILALGLVSFGFIKLFSKHTIESGQVVKLAKVDIKNISPQPCQAG